MAVSARPALLLRSPITTATRALLTAAAPVRPLLARSTFRARIATIAMATPPAVELWVKGDPKTDTLLDCACHILRGRRGEGSRGGGGAPRGPPVPTRALSSLMNRSPSLHTGPFSHRALLTAETKAVPYKRGFIDFAAKPDW